MSKNQHGPLAIKDVWMGSGFEIYDGGNMNNSVAVSKRNLEYFLIALTEADLRHSHYGIGEDILIEFRPRTVVMADYQDRKLTIKRNQVPELLKLLTTVSAVEK